MPSSTPISYLKRKLGLRLWIEQVLGESIINENDENKKDLAQVLQNGVIICKVMLAVRDGSIPKIHTNTTLQFKMRENIMFFLHACEDVGITRHKIFSIPDLLENKNFFKVLECLEELAIIAQEENTGLPPLKVIENEGTFTDEEIKQADQVLKSIGVYNIKSHPAASSTARRRSGSQHSSATIRRSAPLPQHPSSSSPSSSSGPSQSSLSPSSFHPTAAVPPPRYSTSSPKPIRRSVDSSTSSSNLNAATSSLSISASSSKPPARALPTRRGINSMPADIAKTQKQIHFEFELTPTIISYTRAWVKLQAIVRGHIARRMYQKRVRNAAYRHNIAKEILTTERIYVKNLKILVKVFLEPMREAMAAGKLNIKPEQIKGVFSDIEVILNYNTKILEDLEPIVTNWSATSRLGSTFLAMTAFLKVYTQYVKDYNNALSTLNTLKENSKFAQFVKDCEASPDSTGQELNSFLILPIQRIPRYSLLLAELVKHTWPDHRDYQDLCNALKKVQEVAIYVNEKKREAENISRVLEIQNNFTGKFENLAEPHRRVVKEGPLIAAGKDAAPRVFYLFNDLLVGTKPVLGLFQKKEMQKVKEFLRLNQMEFYETIQHNRPPRLIIPSSSLSSSPISSPSTPSSLSSSTGSNTPTTPTTVSIPASSSSPAVPSEVTPLSHSAGSVPAPSTASEKIESKPTPEGVNEALGFEFVDYANKVSYRFFTQSADEKEAWLFELRKLKADIEIKRKMAEQSSLKKAQERAQLAKDALSQQYATIRIRGRHVIDTDLGSPVGSPIGSPQDPSSPAPSDDDENVRDFMKIRRNTASRTSPSNRRIISSSNPFPSAPEEKEKEKEKDDKEAKDTKDKLKEKDREKRGSWFNSLRMKKKKPEENDASVSAPLND